MQAYTAAGPDPYESACPMSHPLLKSLLDALSQAGSGAAARGVLQEPLRKLLATPETGAELAAIVAAAREAEDFSAEVKVLEMLTEEARMDRENDGAFGAAFFSALEDAIARLAGTGAITETGTFLLGRCYVRAGLAAPGRLRQSGAVGERDFALPGDLPDLDELLGKLREEVRGDAYALHAALSEMLATIGSEARGALIGEIVAREEPLHLHLGIYWLLDNASGIRRAAADAFLGRARAGKLDAAITSRLLEMQNWLPPDAARDTLDRVLKEALRREAAGGAPPRPWRLHRVLGSVPDGAGAQSFAIAVQRGGQRAIAMLLLKQGFGVKDAYVMPCRSATEQKRMLAHIAEEMDALEVTPEILEPALAAALAEGHALGEPPAHGLIDIVEVCSIRELRPAPMSLGDWIARLDPEGELSRLSPQKLGRLINASADWPDDYDMVRSWFEDSAAVRDIMINAITPRSRRAALWRHLDRRREWWAGLIAKTAALLKASVGEPEDAWIPFAATARALIEGRPLRKIPIMTAIVVESLESADDPWMRLAGDADDADDSGRPPPDDDAGPAAYSPPAPEQEGELKRVMAAASMDITPEWLDGYLAAIVVAPMIVMPSDWLGGLMEREHEFPGDDELQRFLDLLLMRYNAANDAIADADVTGAAIGAHDEQGLRRWAEGFTESVARHEEDWPARTRTGEDKRVLRSIADVAGGRAGASGLKPLLPAWLTHRRAARR